MSRSPPVTISGRTDDNIEINNLWDDSALVAAYERAEQKAYATIAKRDADESPHQFVRPHDVDQPCLLKTKKKYNWRQGQACCAVNEKDGVEYEGFITQIKGDTCVIRFLGFDNEQTTPLSELKPTKGKKICTEQIKAAFVHNFDAYQHTSDSETTNSVSESSSTSKGTSSRNPKKMKFQLPDINSLPNLPHFPGGLPLAPPMPVPMMPVPMSSGNQEEDIKLSTLAMSWYMSGYYTALYQSSRR